MTPDTFKRVLDWSPDDEDGARRGGGVGNGCAVTDWRGGDHMKMRPAPWPEIMTAQRLAWHHGADEAYARLYGPKASAA